MGQCCTTDSGNMAVADNMLLAPSLTSQSRQNRKLESATKTKGKEIMDKKANMDPSNDNSQRDRLDTYAGIDSFGSRSTGSSVKRTLSISIPADVDAEHNPDYTSPKDSNINEQFSGSESDEMVMIPNDSVKNMDGQSENMVMMQSDSQSSFASEMVRMDSEVGLSQTSSF